MEIEDAHKFLLSLGYTYTGQTCGCGGSAKKRTYNKTDNKIIINLSKQSLNSASTSNNGQSVSMYAVGKNSNKSGNGTDFVTDAGLLLLVSILK